MSGNPDGERVQRAEQLIAARRMDEAEPLLRDVISRIPDDYRFEFEEGGKRYAHFWDMGEFMAYVARSQATGEQVELVWLGNTVGKALFLLGFILVDRHDFAGAEAVLRRGIELEPGQMGLRLEYAQALGMQGRRHEALAQYDAVLAARESAAPHYVARALRGKAIQQIELGDLRVATELLNESLVVEPDNPVARQELAYIAALEQGVARKVPLALHVPNADTGGEKGRDARQEKKWWQFWR
jgi:tetratricopeptide (TPR) repeat protein